MFLLASVCSQLGWGLGEYPGSHVPSGRVSRGWVPGGEYSPLLLTPSGSHQNMYGLQAGGTHPNGMLSCNKIFLTWNMEF